MKKTLVACRTGMGSSMLLKIKIDQVIKENKFQLEVEHSTLDAVKSFNGDLIITMADVAHEIETNAHIIGINNLMDKNEIKEKIEGYLNNNS